MKHRRGFGLLVLALALAVPAATEAQKRPLEHTDYDLWNRIQNQRLTPDGRFVTYQLTPGEGDGRVVVRDLRSGADWILERGADARFTGDSRYLVAVVKPAEAAVEAAKEDPREGEEAPPEPKDSLVVVDLSRLGQGASAFVSRVERVQGFKVPDDGNGWVAYLLEGEDGNGASGAGPGARRRPGGGPPGGLPGRGASRGGQNGGDDGPPRTDDGSTLVVFDPASGTEARFDDAVLYEFAQDGEALFFTASKEAVEAEGETEAEEGNDGLFMVEWGAQQARALVTGEGRYVKLALSEDGERAAVLTDRDDREAEEPAFALYTSDVGTPATAAVTHATAGIPEGWWISENGDLSFSESGERLFFGTAPRPEPEPEEEVDPDDAVVVDIWNWKDPLLQPMQLVQLNQELNRTYDAVLEDGDVTQIETEDLQTVTFGDSKDLDVGFASSGMPYRQEISWTGRFSDLYVVDADTGERELVAERVGGRASMSAGGKYVTWWDGSERAWMVRSVAGGETRNVTANVGVPVFNELDDHPTDPPPYGTAGWTEDDEHLLVYDKFDIWAVDPMARSAPRNVTEGVGRANDIRFRYVRLRSEGGGGGGFFGFGGGGAQEAIPADEDVVLSAFHLYDKSGGFYRDRFDGNREPRLLVMDDARFGNPLKAEDADVLLFTRQTFRDFPDLHVSGSDFSDMEKISEANPQQADYTWGTAELMSWNSNDGVPLQGILYKPDDFDPSRQYPMMVYFYERSSDGLHGYTTPAAGGSSINRAFYVSRGYVLFVPDIPYIDGYPGESAIDAVVPGVLSVVDQGFVDRDRIGVQGHSWGGYQITYMITRTDLFAVAEAGAPVSNMTSAYGGIRWQSGMSRAFQYETGQSRIGGSLWETPLRYIENSALFTADKINTPLLMMHNDEDGAVPWYQGIELFSAMRRLDKPVWMLNYNGEAHGLRREANRKDWAVRMQQFFDHYLQGAPPAVWMIDGVPATQKGKTLGLELMKKKTIS